MGLNNVWRTFTVCNSVFYGTQYCFEITKVWKSVLHKYPNQYCMELSNVWKSLLYGTQYSVLYGNQYCIAISNQYCLKPSTC